MIHLAADEPHDESNDDTDDACDHDDMEHGTEIRKGAAFVLVQIVFRTPAAFIPVQEESGEDGKHADTGVQQSDFAHITETQTGFGINRIAVRFIDRRALEFPLGQHI